MLLYYFKNNVLTFFLPCHGNQSECASEAFCYWKGDMEAHVYSHFLIFLEGGGRYYKCKQCCDFCLATSDRRALELSWGHLTQRALWKHTMTMHDAADPSPWTAVPRFEKSKRLLDLLHLVHQGVLRDLIASSLVDALEDGSLGCFYGMQNQSHNEILKVLSRHAQAWARDAGMQLYIGKLTMGRLGRPEKLNWPYAELESRVKAAKTRTLFGFTTFLMSRLATSPILDQQPQKRLHAKVRSICCWALDVVLSTFSKNQDVVMQSAVAAEVAWLARLHSACYQWLAVQCLHQQRCLYKVRPKTHYFVHLMDTFAQNCICLMHLSTFGDEDFMGKIRGVAQAAHGSTYMSTWARRYALKRALQWRGMKEKIAWREVGNGRTWRLIYVFYFFKIL